MREEITPCDCGADHHWTYKLEKSADGRLGCYCCLENCDMCEGRVFRSDLVKYDGLQVCAGCKGRMEKEDSVIKRVVQELAA